MKNIFDLDIMNKADDLYHQQSAYASLKQNTIASNQIQILEQMASGQFGIVYKGWSISHHLKLKMNGKTGKLHWTYHGPPVNFFFALEKYFTCNGL